MMKYFAITIILFIFTVNIGFGNDIKPIKIKHDVKPNIEYMFTNYSKYGKYYWFDIKINTINIIIVQTIYGNILFYPIIEK